MLSIEEAQNIIFSVVNRLPAEDSPLIDSLGRVLIDEITSPFDIPMVATSAMDGFALAFEELTGRRIPVEGFVAAGSAVIGQLARGKATRIMTGAPLPPGCDTVVPVEETVALPDGSILLKGKVRRGAHVRRRGEDIAAGDCVMGTGCVIRPQEIGMAASLGLTRLKVRRRAEVAILATGDELLELGETPVPGRIVNSNSYSLAAQVLEAGAQPELVGIARDDIGTTREMVRKGAEADVLVISGGVSVGDRDFVKEAILDLGGEVLFWKVDMKPGKPVVFAVLAGTPIFALPGNPVAAMVGFEMFVRPALLKMMGHSRLFRQAVRGTLSATACNKGERPHLLRAQVSASGDRYRVCPFGNQSSANLRSMTASNALVRLPPRTELKAGAEVEVLLLDAIPAAGAQDEGAPAWC
jgi:molybdopterin molybdotransferase